MIPEKSGYFPRDWKKQPILYLWSRATSSTERAVSRRGTRSLSTPSSHSPLRLSSFTTWHSYLTLVLLSLTANCEKSFMWKLHNICECYFHINSLEAQLPVVYHKKCLSFFWKTISKNFDSKIWFTYQLYDILHAYWVERNKYLMMYYSERHSEIKIFNFIYIYLKNPTTSFLPV